MGKNILTARQSDFLELAQSDPTICKNFYLTGGTALAVFYYYHRESHDVDLFCEKKEINTLTTDAFLRKISQKLHIINIKRSQFLGLVSYDLIFKGKDKLKVDFNYYPFPRIDKGIKFKNLEIDSIYDIAANKLHTIFMKPRIRDYIDLYLILTKEKFNFEDLIINTKAKFDWHIDRINLASQFLRVKELSKSQDYPKMLVSFQPQKMERFFLKLAKDLGKEILY